ncbi:MAG: phenol 2-monooxygenase [Tetrasphaera sp.]|nr:phenol 2-monooxygenase [Tetrasphaera sp.]
MQIELRTQVIEANRKTFAHLVERYGDRPASRYEEGSIGIQAEANFHYRPLWGPDKDIYSPDYSVLKLADPYSFTDPRQFYYAAYVTSRADMHESFGTTLAYLEKRDLFGRLPEAWKSLFQDVVLPFRHYEAAGEMICANACRFGWGTSTTQCFGYAAFDRIGNAQLLSRVGISFAGGTAESLGLAKTDWLEDAAFQGLRKHVEEMIVDRDWGTAMVALDVTDQLIYAMLFDKLDDAAITSGAGSYSLVAQHLSGWFADQRRWFDALYKAGVADPEYGAANVATLAAVVDKTLATAVAALTPIAAKGDALVGAGLGDVLAGAADGIRTKFAGLGITTEA